MTTDLWDKKDGELIATISLSSIMDPDARECLGEVASRLAEAEQKIVERDAMLAHLFEALNAIRDRLRGSISPYSRTAYWLGANSHLQQAINELTPVIDYLPASAKATTEILRAADAHCIGASSMLGGCDCAICQAVRAAREIK